MNCIVTTGAVMVYCNTNIVLQAGGKLAGEGYGVTIQ